MSLRFRAPARSAVPLAFVAALLAVLPLEAQERGRVTGRVVDAATNRPLPGVQVFVPDAGIGNLTDGDGRYLLLNVPVGQHTIRAQLVGYREASQTVTVAADQAAIVNLALSESAIKLDQIVVTGAGVATEAKKLGNTIATIDMDRLETAPITSFSDVLQGREPGVAVLPSSGTTGEGARIRIRGSSSLSQLNEPIIYVDGIRVDRSGVDMATGGQGLPSKLDDIPPDAIERIEILKGAAAATLYGTEASNGVIQVFTKKGRQGAPRFTFQTEWSAIKVPTGRMLPLSDFAESQADIDRISSRWGMNVGLYEPFQLDLMPDFFETGFAQNYSASVAGGGEFATYFVSARWADEQGPWAGGQVFEAAPGIEPAQDKNRRLQSTANLAITPHEKLRLNVSTLYSEMNHETPDNSNNIYGAFSSLLMMQPRLATQTNLFGAPAFATTRENLYQHNLAETSHFAGSINANYAPIQAVRLDATFGIDFSNDDVVWYRPFRWNVDDFSSSLPDGYRYVAEWRRRELTADFKGSWETNFTDDISSTFLAGTQGFLTQKEVVEGTGNRFPGPGLAVVGAAADQSVGETWLRVTQIGGYVQEQLGWRDWAFGTVGGRWDANSAFGEEFNTAFYPKASISVIPTEAFGWENPTFSTLRLRAAIGRSGLQPGAFDQLTTFGPLPSEEGPGVQPDNLGNPQLKPEVSTEIEAGAELGLLSDRLSFDLTYWDRTVEDALIARQFPVTGGFVSTQLDNIGQVEAHGLELGFQGNVLQSENLSITVFANANYLREKVADMGGAPPLKTGGSYPRYRNFITEGFAPGAFFGAEVARHLEIPLNLDGSCTEPSRAQALEYFSKARNPSEFKPLALGNSDFGTPNGALASHNCGEGLLLSYLGKPTPDWSGSFGFTVGFLGNFELNSNFEYKAGNFFVQDLSGMFRRANSVIGRNTPRAAELEAIMKNPGSSAEARLDAAVAWANEIEGLSPMSGMNGVHPADFIRWRELSLTYRAPTSLASRLGLASASITVGGRNLALMVNDAYTGMDPEGNVLGRCSAGLGGGLNASGNTGLDCNFLDSTEGWGIPIPRRLMVSTRVSF